MNKVIATLSILLVCFSSALHAQTVINKYAEVKDYDPCNNRIKVEDASQFNIGDTILIIQMKGTTIDSISNAASFGDTIAYYGAGNYEYNTIKTKNGNLLGLYYRVKRTYQWTWGKVQIVKVPTFQNYTVNQTLTCDPWDGTKGGVLAFTVANTLTLNADIDVSGKGFRGAAPLFSTQQSCNRTDYYYPATNNFGAPKGEGISEVSPLKMYGKGKLANGGGGGNDNNSGGAGGGNGGDGGDGGDQLQSVVCAAPLIPDIGGVGGLALNYTSVSNKVFLGGGGGAGHGNDNGQTGGGNGGGIVLLNVGTLIGNNFSINANGADAPQCSAPGPNCQDDGTGGGGAGGAIAIKAGTISNLLQINSKGGKGADAYSSVTVNATFQPGPGGGGGGGAVWFTSGSTPAGVTVNTTGGSRGVLPQFNNNANGSQVGKNGVTQYNLVLGFPVVPNDTFVIKYNLDFLDSIVSCATRKFVNLTSPTTNVFAWGWDFGDGTTDTAFSPTHTYGTGGTYTVTLSVQDNTGCTDTIRRQIVVDALNYSVKDTVLGCKTIGFEALKNSGPGGMKFHWDFGDNDTLSGNPVTHIYQNGGPYTVVLTVTDSSGCEDTTQFQLDVADVLAGFTVSDDSVCQGEAITFTTTASANAIFHAYDFGDGLVDSTLNPVHIYPLTNVYTVSQIVGDITGCLDTAYHTILVDSISSVDYTASDSVLCEGNGIILHGFYIKDNAIGIDWDLGDGFIATNVDPVTHAYDTAGNYNVTLTVHFRACPDITYGKMINIKPFPTVDLGPDTTMCPNGAGIVLVDNVNVSNPNAKWLWNTGDTTNTITVRHPGIYTARVDLNGCVTNDSVEVFKDCYIDIPNAFTPNNDGSNDYFLPRQLISKNVATFRMTIWNRWGQEVFQTSSVNGRGWDGKFNGEDQPMEVYIYRVDVTFTSGTSESYTGNLTLVR